MPALTSVQPCGGYRMGSLECQKEDPVSCSKLVESGAEFFSILHVWMGTVVAVMLSAMFSPSVAAGQPHADSIRAELQAVPLQSKLTVQLWGGERVTSAQGEVCEEDFYLWVQAGEILKDRIRHGKAKTHIPFEDAESILELEERASASTAEFRQDLKLQPYVFGGGGSFISYGGTVFEFGGGLDWLVKGGLGLGFSLSVLGDPSAAIGVASFDVSYHFIRDSSPIVPFVFAGIAGGSAAEYGTEGYTFIDLGGGANLWSSMGLAFRVEARGRFDPTEYGDHQVGIRLGVTF